MRLIPWLLPTLLLACAGPTILPESSPTRVTITDHRNGTTIGLLNEAWTSSSDWYSQVRRSSTYKVVSNEEMGALLAQLDQLTFFEASRPGTSRMPGARKSVVVEKAGQAWTLAFAATDPAEHVQAVSSCGEAVRFVYNSAMAYQLVDNPGGAEFFQAEQRSLNTRRPQ